ncbi:MAG: hypothetical protein HY289_07955 [Planctomycetes bacterium]|nr:hypothetical protein [Planctomycetota bacterium]
MVPSSIKSNLAGLRLRERLLTFVWGVACWVAILIVLLFLFSLVDWLIDRRRDTPFAVLLGMFFVKAVVAGLAGILFILLPQIRRMPDSLMALWVEAKKPKFEHRLISAVQLNEPGADTVGMSRELIGVVTGEAEKLTQKVGAFSALADHRRLIYSVCVLFPIVLVCGCPVAIWPGMAMRLIGRQFLLPIEIPHSVTLEGASQHVWPIGEDIPIQIRVRGEYAQDMVGVLYVTPDGESTQRYDLKFLKADDDGALFGTFVKPSSVDLVYSARLADGRTKRPTEMKLVARPIVTANNAFVQLPAYCGLKPEKPNMTIDDRRYEVPQARGDVVGIRGSTVRVDIQAQKKIVKAWIELLGEPGLGPKGAEAANANVDRRRMAVGSDEISASARFDLTDRVVGYRIIVEDEHGFENVPPPRRTVGLVPEDAPTVSLLRDTFTDTRKRADFDLEGLPVILGGNIRITYVCYGNYGLGKAQVMYRVLKKHESGNEPADEDAWITAPLPEVPAPSAFGVIESVEGVEGQSAVVTTKENHRLRAGELVLLVDVEGVPEIGDKKTFTIDEVKSPTSFSLKELRTAGKGKGGLFVWMAVFNPTTGAFRHSDFDQQVQFHAMPSAQPDSNLGRTVGGGRYFLDTNGLLDRKTGKALTLKSGDQIEYCIKVHAASREPKYGDVPFAVSETRVSTVMTVTEWLAWQSQVNNQDAKIKELKAHQEGVFPK